MFTDIAFIAGLVTGATIAGLFAGWAAWHETGMVTED